MRVLFRPKRLGDLRLGSQDKSWQEVGRGEPAICKYISPCWKCWNETHAQVSSPSSIIKGYQGVCPLKGKPVGWVVPMQDTWITDMVTSAECLALREWGGEKNSSGRVKMSIPKEKCCWSCLFLRKIHQSLQEECHFRRNFTSHQYLYTW